ncbi:hypothetical protein [Haloplasma contractile]|uniref:Uncharacterized protein n=1 Tax=Haloplasma contractile SSD-17B TaxID=1033810 RepID=F7Q127_9MOLU|nr:hypothetical protein [Haloplasma contractile]ERJ11331.1 hypothetical protein HLPCO_002633 [Haloplasma contractile SSD-17B]
MNEETKKLVEQYLNEQEEKIEKKKEIKKKKDLIKWGLFKEIPVIEDEDRSYYNAELKQYVEKVALDVSDEYYEKIIAYKGETCDHIRINQIIKGIAYAIFLIGLVTGLYSSRIHVLTTLYIWASAFVSGVLFLGFAKVIELLEDIHKNTKK